jgi:O-antigen/teichoic acid export membrane protein
MLSPQTTLRARLEFKAMSQVDAVVQCLATAASVALAAYGAGYVSLVLPQAIAVPVRALAYARLTRGWGESMQSEGARRHSWRELLRDYGLSGLGQYVHGGLIVAPPLVLAAFCTKEIVGYFSTAFALSASFNSIVAVGLGLVLQPVFAHMGADLARQRRAFGRACSVIAAVSIPACICQSLCVAPTFRLAMPASWQDAIVFAQLLSLGQAMYFVVNPAMGLLKAQGRFKAFFVWQTVQLVMVIGGMAACGAIFAEPAIPIVAVYSFYHLVFSPIGLALCIPRGQGLGAAMHEVFVSPFAASAAALAPVAIASWLLPGHPVTDIALLVAAPAAIFTAYPLLLRKLAPETYGDCKGAFETVLRRRTKDA